MSKLAKVVVLYGGVGSEREVSLQSGEAIAQALGTNFEVESLILASEALPNSLKSNTDIVFPALHGNFGEDGRLQALLVGAKIHYCGSDAAASRLCMD